MKADISHEGTITSITDKVVRVQIVSQSACSSCRAKGMCAAFDMSEKEVEVKNDHKYALKAGDHVDLVMTQTMGNKAVVLGYFLPFLLVLLTLIITSQFMGELYAGLVSLAVLAPYYLLLYLLKDRLSNTFDFRVKLLQEAISPVES
ncbi:MAG TPA: SoxR reducing system RseC family protein [Bacteroidales bacterium]|nr:SoxR reducing system RseC family protein [Bacteroidales bacterium]